MRNCLIFRRGVVAFGDAAEYQVRVGEIKRVGFVCVLVVALTVGTVLSRIDGAMAQSPSDISVSWTRAVSGIPISPVGEWRRDPDLNGGHITAAPGSTEARSLVIESKVGLQDVVFKVRGMRCPNRTDTGISFDPRLVVAWYQSGSAWKDFTQKQVMGARLTPELLVRDPALVRVDHASQRNFLRVTRDGNTVWEDVSDRELAPRRTDLSEFGGTVIDADALLPFDIPAGERRQLWLDVRVADEAAADTCGAEAVLTAGGRQIWTSPLTVEILPFALAASPLDYGMFYKGRLTDAPTLNSSRKSASQMSADFRSMAVHGVAHATIYVNNDEEALRRVLAMQEDAGLDLRRLYTLGSAWRKPVKARMAVWYHEYFWLREIAEAFGNQELYLYAADEPTDAVIEGAAWKWEELRESGVALWLAGKPDRIAHLAGAVDVYVAAYRPDPVIAREAAESGVRLLNYNNPQSGAENPKLFRQNAGLLLWATGYDGLMLYAYQDGFGSIWNDFDHKKFRDHTMTLPTTEGPIETLALKGLRAGIDDVRYVTTLVDLIGEAAPDADSTVADRVAAAEQELTELRLSLRANKQKRTPNLGLDLDAIRDRIVGHILAIREAQGR